MNINLQLVKNSSLSTESSIITAQHKRFFIDRYLSASEQRKMFTILFLSIFCMSIVSLQGIPSHFYYSYHTLPLFPSSLPYFQLQASYSILDENIIQAYSYLYIDHIFPAGSKYNNSSQFDLLPAASKLFPAGSSIIQVR